MRLAWLGIVAACSFKPGGVVDDRSDAAVVASPDGAVGATSDASDAATTSSGSDASVTPDAATPDASTPHCGGVGEACCTTDPACEGAVAVCVAGVCVI